jgi:hypothetical protein
VYSEEYTTHEVSRYASVVSVHFINPVGTFAAADRSLSAQILARGGKELQGVKKVGRERRVSQTVILENSFSRVGRIQYKCRVMQYFPQLNSRHA